MALKTGDVKPLPVTLQTSAGVAVTYANKAALLAAGFTFVYWSAGVVVASPTWTWTVVDGTTGRHEIGLTVQAGQGEAYLLPPASYSVNVEAFLLDVESNNLADILGAINTSAGQPAAEDRALVTNITVTEGDSLQRVLTVPLAALSDFGLTDLSTVTAISAAARTGINRIDTSPDFTISVSIVDASARTIALGWATMPTGASISGFTITAVSTSNKTFTLTGDKRSFFDGVTRLLIANSTGNDGYYSLISMVLTGGNTVITVGETPASSTVDGTLAQADDSKDFRYDVQIQFPKAFTITAVNTGTKTFTVSGDRRRWFNVGASIVITGSTGNNGTYTITATALVSGNTTITVSEVVPDATGDGTMTLTLKDSPLEGVITVERQEDRT